MFNKHLSIILLFCSICFFATSCDDDSADPCDKDIENQTATGKYLSTDFTVADGYAEEKPSDATEMSVTLYGRKSPGDVCDGFNFDKPDSSVFFFVKKAVGVYPVTTDNLPSFSYVENSTSVSEGVLCGSIEITSVTSSKVDGKLFLYIDEQNFINGNFSVNYCP